MRLIFRDILGLNKKTITQEVLSGELSLGLIKWYAPWRRYCFFPHKDCLFDASCLGQIVNHLTVLMTKRKEIA